MPNYRGTAALFDSVTQDVQESNTQNGKSSRKVKADSASPMTAEEAAAAVQDAKKKGKASLREFEDGRRFVDLNIDQAQFDVTKIENVTQDIISSYGDNPKSNFLRDTSMDIIFQEKKKSNNVWKAILHIANSANGDKILYDIKPIKMVEGTGNTAANTTTANISQSGENGNTQNGR